jgi:hypothetical protein
MKIKELNTEKSSQSLGLGDRVLVLSGQPAKEWVPHFERLANEARYSIKLFKAEKEIVIWCEASELQEAVNLVKIIVQQANDSLIGSQQIQKDIETIELAKKKEEAQEIDAIYGKLKI